MQFPSTLRLFTDDANGRGNSSVPVDEIKELVTHQLQETRLLVRDFVASHPTASIVAAASAGVFFGWWMKRR